MRVDPNEKSNLPTEALAEPVELTDLERLSAFAVSGLIYSPLEAIASRRLQLAF